MKSCTECIPCMPCPKHQPREPWADRVRYAVVGRLQALVGPRAFAVAQWAGDAPQEADLAEWARDREALALADLELEELRTELRAAEGAIELLRRDLEAAERVVDGGVR